MSSTRKTGKGKGKGKKAGDVEGKDMDAKFEALQQQVQQLVQQQQQQQLVQHDQMLAQLVQHDQMLAQLRRQGQPRMNLSTGFMDKVKTAAENPSLPPFELAGASQEEFPIELDGKHADLWPTASRAPSELQARTYRIGYEDGLEETKHVQPLAELLFCHLRHQFAPNCKYAAVDIHHDWSTSIWGISVTDMALFYDSGATQSRTASSGNLNIGNLAAAMEIKGASTIGLLESLAQLVRYLETALLQGPLRQRVVGLLTDLQRGRLVVMERLSDGSHDFTISEWYSGGRLLQVMRALLECPPETLNAAPFQLRIGEDHHFQEYFAVRRLGHGVSGDIVEVQHATNQHKHAVKGLVPGDYDYDLEPELEVMRKVIKGESPFLGVGRVQKGCSKQLGKEKSVIVMDVYAPNSVENWSLDHVESIVDALKKLHQEIGYIHRDIQPSNFLISNNHPVLVDFGCAIQPGEWAPYWGSRCYAAFRFLPLRRDGSTFVFRPEDDLISLILTVFVIFHTAEGNIERCPAANPEDIRPFWYNVLPRAWILFIEAIESGDASARRRWQSQLHFLEGSDPAEENELLDVYDLVKLFLRLHVGQLPLHRLSNQAFPPSDLLEATAATKAPLRKPILRPLPTIAEDPAAGALSARTSPREDETKDSAQAVEDGIKKLEISSQPTKPTSAQGNPYYLRSRSSHA